MHFVYNTEKVSPNIASYFTPTKWVILGEKQICFRYLFIEFQVYLSTDKGNINNIENIAKTH